MLRKQSADSGNHSNGNHQRRHTINSVADSSTGICLFLLTHQIHRKQKHYLHRLNLLSLGNNISRQLSTDSVSSLNSLSSACSASSSAQHSEADKKKKRGWVRPHISVC